MSKETKDIKVYVGVDSVPGEIKKYQIRIDYTDTENTNSVLGHKITKQDIVDSLRSIGVKLTKGKYKFEHDYGIILRKDFIELYKIRGTSLPTIKINKE